MNFNDPFAPIGDAPFQSDSFGTLPSNQNSQSIGFEFAGNTNTPRPIGSNMGSPSIQSTRVVSCNFFEMVEQANMGFRPFISNVVSTDVLDRIPDFVRENRNSQFRSETFKNIANDLVQLSSSITGNIPIVNGWNTKRYSVVIMAEVMLSTGGRQVYMIEGFTDTPSISTQFNQVRVDNEMVIYVNNVTSFSERSNNFNQSTNLVPIASYNVIDDKPLDKSNIITSQIVTQRPYDISGLAIGGALIGLENRVVIDSRNSLSVEAKPSSLENNNPATYVAKIINHGVDAIESTGFGGINEKGSLQKMMDSTKEPSISDNSFLRALSRANQMFSSTVTSFTWKELLRLDPALSNPNCEYLNVFTAERRSAHLPSSAGMCDDVTGSNYEQLFAASIANCVADLLSKCGATNVSLVASNQSGLDVVKVNGMSCFVPTETKTKAVLFEALFARTIMQVLNQKLEYVYNVTVQSTLWGDTVVNINLGYGLNTYMFPNFANSVYSPMLTSNSAGTNEISKHMMTVTGRFQQELETGMHGNFIPQSSGSVI